MYCVDVDVTEITLLEDLFGDAEFNGAEISPIGIESTHGVAAVIVLIVSYKYNTLEML